MLRVLFIRFTVLLDVADWASLRVWGQVSHLHGDRLSVEAVKSRESLIVRVVRKIGSCAHCEAWIVTYPSLIPNESGEVRKRRGGVMMVFLIS